MKVKDLIDLLSTLDQEAEVVLSSDAEGNSYSPLASHCPGRYIVSTGWAGDFYADGDWGTDDDGLPCGVPAVVLWPTN